MLGDLGIRLDEAESLVQRALKEEPYNGAYLDSLGWIYFKQNKLAKAEATLRKAVWSAIATIPRCTPILVTYTPSPAAPNWPRPNGKSR